MIDVEAHEVCLDDPAVLLSIDEGELWQTVLSHNKKKPPAIQSLHLIASSPINWLQFHC